MVRRPVPAACHTAPCMSRRTDIVKKSPAKQKEQARRLMSIRRVTVFVVEWVVIVFIFFPAFLTYMTGTHPFRFKYFS